MQREEGHRELNIVNDATNANDTNDAVCLRSDNVHDDHKVLFCWNLEPPGSPQTPAVSPSTRPSANRISPLPACVLRSVGLSVPCVLSLDDRLLPEGPARLPG